MFQLDDYDNISPELHSIYNAGFLGLFTGLCYGGFIGSRKSYTDFMDRNQATAFTTHLEAKKKLQDSMLISFAKTGWKFGWRIGLFAMTYVGISTFISVYRNEFTIFEYIIGGATTGALYKWKMGPRGMTAGFLVGGALGIVGGAFSVGIMKLTGTTMKEVRYWQYKWKTDRRMAYKDAWDEQLKETDLSFKNSKLQTYHDEKLGEKAIELNQLPDK
ncbi:hypothetical protein PVAND_003846 [Polypedilum vanderplanki]|uniref:Complex I assembly factor TIMMDC1, mitochondrial n=1 Tax=Polypedilum vanderplanki TaxID=319348 RepID=A0A9J6BVU4_POLVA|nr:hypothetical protein PVAND_003846 [Polypedilum vanderplanki]